MNEATTSMKWFCNVSLVLLSRNFIAIITRRKVADETNFTLIFLHFVDSDTPAHVPTFYAIFVPKWETSKAFPYPRRTRGKGRNKRRKLIALGRDKSPAKILNHKSKRVCTHQTDCHSMVFSGVFRRTQFWFNFLLLNFLIPNPSCGHVYWLLPLRRSLCLPSHKWKFPSWSISIFRVTKTIEKAAMHEGLVLAW